VIRTSTSFLQGANCVLHPFGFPKPKGKGKAPGKVAIKVINHYGDEVLKVYSVEA
jgi:hypothetical protein